MNVSTRRDWSWLVLFAFALVLRLVWLAVGPVVIENEGGAYTTVAEHLLRGEGFASVYGVPDTMYTLMYPFMIAVVTFFTGNSEIGMRLTSLLSGAATVLPIYFIALTLYGRSAAKIAALLAAVSPLLIGFSLAGYTETPYMLFVMSGTYFTLRSVELVHLRYPVLAGVFWGCAYLTRPEGIVFAGLAIAAIVVTAWLQKQPWRKAATAALLVGLTTAVLALPYVLYLKEHTGQYRLEGKNIINYVIIHRMEAGMTYNEASWGIDENLEEGGPLLTPINFATHSPYPVTFSGLFGHLPQRIAHNASAYLQEFLPSFSYGGPVLLVCLALGFFRHAWTPTRLRGELVVGLIGGYVLAIFMMVHIIWFRYTMPFFPFLIVWASNGAQEFCTWCEQTATGLCTAPSRLREFAERWTWRSACFGLISVFAALGYVGAKYNSDLTQGYGEYRVLKDAGLWLRDYAPNTKKVVMDVSTQVAYYSGGYFGGLPNADSALALRYLEKKAPDFIVIWSGSLEKRPYLKDWLEHGIPSPHAQLVHEAVLGADNRVKIYRWH
ncbi:MAG: glycosyltransferase family 39 protein [Gammaproteobacteria bacterium]|nr:glycosyltransferase family 39 protein [Gammaproteobacteria bacterium]